MRCFMGLSALPLLRVAPCLKRPPNQDRVSILNFSLTTGAQFRIIKSKSYSRIIATKGKRGTTDEKQRDFET